MHVVDLQVFELASLPGMLLEIAEVDHADLISPRRRHLRVFFSRREVFSLDFFWKETQIRRFSSDPAQSISFLI